MVLYCSHGVLPVPCQVLGTTPLLLRRRSNPVNLPQIASWGTHPWEKPRQNNSPSAGSPAKCAILTPNKLWESVRHCIHCIDLLISHFSMFFSQHVHGAVTVKMHPVVQWRVLWNYSWKLHCIDPSTHGPIRLAALVAAHLREGILNCSDLQGSQVFSLDSVLKFQREVRAQWRSPPLLPLTAIVILIFQVWAVGKLTNVYHQDTSKPLNASCTPSMSSHTSSHRRASNTFSGPGKAWALQTSSNHVQGRTSAKCAASMVHWKIKTLGPSEHVWSKHDYDMPVERCIAELSEFTHF